MGLFDALEKGVNKFFDGLKQGAADRALKMAKKQKLSPEAKKAMKEMEKDYDDFLDMLNI